MVEKVFLTPERRSVLEGRRDHSSGSTSTHKVRIRRRAKRALEELIEVAESDEIDKEDVFNPDQIRRLLIALFGDHRDIQPYYEAWEESDEALSEYKNKYEYERSLAEVLQHMHTLYVDLLLSPDPPLSAKERTARAEWLSAIDWRHFKKTDEKRVNNPEALEDVEGIEISEDADTAEAD